MRRNTVADFQNKVARSGPDDCWLWTGSVGASGYGQMSIAMRRVMPHRYSYELTHGPIPDGLFVCHTCDQPLCCNPAHLFLGTAADNNADRDRKGRGKADQHPASHGTHSGYLRHLRQRSGEWAMPACQSCRDAANAAQKAYQRRAKNRRATESGQLETVPARPGEVPTTGPHTPNRSEHSHGGNR